MVKNRNLVILAGVLVVLLAISVFQKVGHEKSTSRSSTEVLVEGTLIGEDLERITVGHGEQAEAVDLVKGPTGWLVGSAYDAPANQSRVDALLRSLSDLSGEFRAEKASVLVDFGLDPASAVTLRGTGTGGTEGFALDVGLTPERASGSFVRRPDSDRVYLTQVNLLSNLGLYSGPGLPQSSHFIDLQCVSEDRLSVDRIILSEGDSSLELAKVFAVTEPAPDDTTGAVPEIDRNTWEWNLIKPDTQPLAKTKADGVLGALVSIRAVDVDDPAAVPSDYGLADPARIATIFFEDGTQKVLEFGGVRPEEENRPTGTWMRVHGDKAIWVVTDYTVKNIFKSLDDLLPE